MEENLNQPEKNQDYQVDLSNDDINLDEDYVMDWDKNWEEDALQEQEATEVSLGEQAESGEEVADEVRESEDGEYDDEVSEEDVERELEDYGTELGQIEDYEDEGEDEDPRYEQEEDDYEDDYDDDDYLISDEVYESLPEEWKKMMDFMEDYPGSTPEDYVSLTSNDGMSDEQILKMHLASEHGLDVKEDGEELDFLYEDKFGFDEDLDSDRDIKLKKLEAKKALRGAKENLSEVQLKYGADLKFGDASPEIKELQAFQNEQLELQQQNEELATGFQENTHNYFANEFKGFEFEAGGRNLRIKADPNKTADAQSDISNFIEQYMDDSGAIGDLAGYHKALWAAQNADALFSHAYEQGKADAVRSSAKNAKNINMDPRSDRSAERVDSQSGFKLVDEGDNTENFRFNF